MLVVTTNEILQVLGVWIRRTDARLAVGGARNAAIMVGSREQRRFEDARTLRDLRNLLPAETFTPKALQHEPHVAVH